VIAFGNYRGHALGRAHGNGVDLEDARAVFVPVIGMAGASRRSARAAERALLRGG
jgi:hypothetical protein